MTSIYGSPVPTTDENTNQKKDENSTQKDESINLEDATLNEEENTDQKIIVDEMTSDEITDEGTETRTSKTDDEMVVEMTEGEKTGESKDIELEEGEEELEEGEDRELEEGEEEDEDSESDIEIIMDQAPPPKPNDSGMRNSLVNIKPNPYNKQIGQRNENLQLTSRTPGIDLNAIGTIDGTSIYDVDLDSVEEKPWRKPGADITDYFNYGFNEYSWKTYCAKQKQMREDQHSRKKIHVFETKQEINLPPELQSIAQSQTSEHTRFQQQYHHQQHQHHQHQHHQQSQQHQHQHHQHQHQQQQQQTQQRGGRGRRVRDQDDSVIQVVSSEREAALEEMDPIPPPMMDKPQNDEFGPPIAMGMFTEMGGPMGHPPPFFMGNAEIPPSGPMGFDHSYRGGQPVQTMLYPTGITGGLPSNMAGNISGNIPNMSGRIPPMSSNIPGGIPGMPRAISGLSGNIAGNMVGRNERPN